MTKQTTLAVVTTNTAATFNTIEAFTSIAGAWRAADNARAVIELHIANLREAGIRFGKTIKCMYVKQMRDALDVAFGKSKSTATLNNYMTSIRCAVNDGTEFSFSSSTGSVAGKTKGTAGGKKDGGKKAAPEFSTLVAKLFNHPDFEAFCEAVQQNYEDAEADSVLGAVKVYLEAEGFEFGEDAPL